MCRAACIFAFGLCWFLATGLLPLARAALLTSFQNKLSIMKLSDSTLLNKKFPRITYLLSFLRHSGLARISSLFIRNILASPEI
jgi:hypothetical protein